MNACKNMRRSMLTASPDVLRGVGDDPVARHIAACSACARVAGLLLRRMDSLDRALQAGATDLDVEAILARAAGRGEHERALPPEHVRPGLRPRRWRRWAPVALAACVAALLFLVRSQSHAPREAAASRGFPPAGIASAAVPTVESAPGHNVAVIPTDNPDITVVWYF